jgi:TPR repeat protein
VQNISYGVPVDTEQCKLGRTGECWRECFQRSQGGACYLLGVMFETGHGVPHSHSDALSMSALAVKLGYVPASVDVEMAAPYLDLWGHDSRKVQTTESSPKTETGAGNVSSPGGLVVYGSVNGDIYLGR